MSPNPSCPAVKSELAVRPPKILLAAPSCSGRSWRRPPIGIGNKGGIPGASHRLSELRRRKNKFEAARQILRVRLWSSPLTTAPIETPMKCLDSTRLMAGICTAEGGQSNWETKRLPDLGTEV